MGTLQTTISDDLKTAMKAKDKQRLSVLRMTLADIKNKAVEKGLGPQGDLADDDVLGLIQTGIKRRKESASTYRENDRTDLAETEEAEIEILQTYMPAQLSDDELAAEVDAAIAETGASGMSDMGQVMKATMDKVGSSAEGSRVSAMVKSKLAG